MCRFKTSKLATRGMQESFSGIQSFYLNFYSNLAGSKDSKL